MTLFTVPLVRSLPVSLQNKTWTMETLPIYRSSLSPVPSPFNLELLHSYLYTRPSPLSCKFRLLTYSIGSRN